MGSGHHHAHDGPPPDVHLSLLARRATLALLVVVAAATLVGLILLWPTERPQVQGGGTLSDPSVVLETGRVTALTECTGVDPSLEGIMHDCTLASVELSSGDRAGETVPVELIGVAARSGIAVGDTLRVTPTDTPDGGAVHALVTVDRTPTLVVFGVLFVVAISVVAGWKGVRGLLGLVISLVVLFVFMLPALTSGQPAVPVALVGSTAIMFVVLYVAHGISMRTTSAFVGTLLSLLATAGLGALGVWSARLSGLSTDETISLAGLLGDLDFSSILTCSLVIAGLGVLNDVTITQSSAVWELRAANPDLSRRELFASGMRIGRDHIASTIYTIVFAYAGASLPVLLLLSLYDQPLHLLLSTELFSEEIVRTLGTAIGLILSVPLTTGVAALTVGGAAGRAEPPSLPRRALVH